MKTRVQDRKAKLDALREAGYQAALNGEPCNAPTTRELDRAAWEIGYRAAKNEMERVTR